MADYRTDSRLSKSLKRKSSRRKASQRDRRRGLLERLEPRHLLTGPELFAIRPDELALLNDGDVLHEAPREFNLLFKGGADIDEATILNDPDDATDDSIRLVRSGGDGVFGNGNDVVVDLGFVGLNDPANPVQIVMRPASSSPHNAFRPEASMPDDWYRIEILGAIPTPLESSTLGEAANSGLNVFRNFRLDLGAQVVAVVPQPITRTGPGPTNSLSQDRSQVVVYFDDQNLNPLQAQDPKFYRLTDTALTSDESGGSRDRLLLPQSVVYDSNANTATLNFSAPIPEGTYRLDIGQADEPNGTLSTAINVGTLFQGSPFSYLGYLGDHDGTTSTNAADVDVYKVNLRAGTNLAVTAAPHSAGFDIQMRLRNAAGVDITGTAAYVNGAAGVNDTLNFAVPSTNDYYVEIISGAQHGSYLLTMAGNANLIPASDQNSSFAQAAANADLGVLGGNPLLISSQIEPQSLALPQYPGGNDEPGHRLIQAEDHGAGSGVTAVVPNAISVVTYTFPPTLGTDTQGNPYLNLITETEKQIAREILETYASYLGVQFQESTTGGMRIGKGDPGAFRPELAGPNSPSLGGGSGVIIQNAGNSGSTREFGDGFFSVLYHELGHAIGLGHSYDLASVQGQGVPGPVYPGDHDLVHLQRLHRPDATDIDLYQFNVTERGKFSAEITAERLPRTSHLNSVLTLFNQNREVIARNDDYYSNDSFLSLDLEPGTYYIGVTSTGNIDYDPAIADSGFGGKTDGLYNLSLNFDPDTGAILADSDGTFFDGDADGSPTGVYQFWFETSDYTLFVDKANDTTANQVNGDGSLGNPYDTISDPLGPTQAAFDRAATRIIVPLTGGEAINDSDRITIDDGINPPLTFQFDCSNAGLDPNCNNDNPPRQIPFEPNDTADTVAAAIVTAIQTEIGLGNLTGITVTRDSVNSPRLIQLTSSTNASLPKVDVSLTPALVNTPNLVRIVGHPGLDQNISSTGDNRPYLVGISQAGTPLADGSEFQVPQGTTVMIDAGTLFKLRKGNLDAGTSASDNDRRGSAIQIFGTPSLPVLFRSFHDDSFGGNSDGVGPQPQPGDFGGIVFRADSDLEGQQVYLNYVNHADMTHGGGKVIVDSVESVFTPVHMVDARPTVAFNSIRLSEDAAISANPNSFSDDAGRIGPDIHGNLLLSNTVNGLFVRIETLPGNNVDKLSVTGRWDDTDITHVLTENLQIYGAAGGALISTESQTISIAGGPPTSGTFTLQFTDHNGNSQLTGNIQYNAPASTRTNKIVLLRAAGATSGTFELQFQGQTASPAVLLQYNATAGDVLTALEALPNINPGDVTVSGGPLNGAGVTIEYTGALAGTTVAGLAISTTGANGLSVTNNTVVPAAPAVTNVSNVIIPIREHLENLPNILPGDVVVTGGPLPVNPITVSFVNTFASLDLPPMQPTSSLSAGVAQVQTASEGRSSGRTAGRLAVDPGVVVKLANARIEAERGASQLIAEGSINRPIVFTSISDDRFGGAGTFDVNDNGLSQGSPGDWSGLIFNHVSSGSIDNALIAFGGGDSPIKGTSTNFNVLEVHQARLRLTNSVIESNANGSAAGTRDGRGSNAATTVFVRGAQPVIVNNVFQDNTGSVISINANSLHYNTRQDYGRSTGPVDEFEQFDVNKGPLVRQNRLGDNGTNGMVVRGELLTTESVWDDTDIVHVLLDEISLLNHHTYSGLRLQSSNEESLVVKLLGATAGFRVGGVPLDMEDRIGGTIHVLGTVGHPVVLTSLTDDSVGAGFTPDGQALLDTDNGGSGVGTPGQWNTILLESLSNDRNVAVVRELEDPLTDGNDVNFAPGNAQFLGVLAPNQKSGDENRRLGFETHGVISPNDPTDVDVYSFSGTAGTEVWLDIDRTDPALDAVLELVSAAGVVQAISTSTTAAPTGTLAPNTLGKNPQQGGDYYTLNRLDPGMRVVLPGTVGATGTYFVRVRSNPQPVSAITNLNGGLTSGEYRLQVRLQQIDEFPGSTIRFADIRYARRGIDVQGVPSHSNLIAEAGEVSGSDFGSPQVLDNLLQTDMAALGISGNLSTPTNVDWYRFNLNFADIQSIPGVNEGDKTVGVTFDLDYADQAGRADTTIAVFDQAGQLIFVGRESNVANDQAAPGQAPDIDDLSRGSLGVKDPFIGAIQLPVGTPAGASRTYYVAVASDRMLPNVLDATFLSNAPNKRVRLEPVNSVTRVVEDHIGAEAQGYHSLGMHVPAQDTDGIFNISNATALNTHVVPFRLQDVVLYVTTDNAGAAAGDALYTVDPFAPGNFLTRVANDYSSGQSDIQDIVIRSDGRMFGYRRVDNDAANVGDLVELNPDTGAVIATFSDNITSRSPSPDLVDSPGNTDEFYSDIATSNDVDALTYERLSSGPSPTFAPNYALYYAVRETDFGAGAARSVNSKLYRANPSNGDAGRDVSGTNNFGQKGDIQPAGVQFAFANVTFNDGNGNVATVRVESKIPGVAGDFTLNITRADNSNAVTSVNATTRSITIRLDNNPSPNAATFVDLINNDATARQFLTAAVTAGSNSTASTAGAPNGAATVNGGDNGTIDLPDGLNGPLRGRVTGLAFGDFNGGQLYGVTDAGEFLLINKSSGTVTRRFDFANAGLPAGFSTAFQGLTLGPQNVEGGAYQNTLFAIAGDGRLYAIDSTLVNTGSNIDVSNPLDVNFATNQGNIRAVLRSIFDTDNDGQANTLDVSPADGIPDGISMRVTGLNNTAVGLAFSPLDFNLWHPTMRRGNDLGHGIPAAPDNSRAPGGETYTVDNPANSGTDRDTNEGAGGASFYFGFEQYNNDLNAGALSYLTYTNGINSQYGITADQRFHSDLSTNAALPNTYNFPGGALGALVTDSFSLAGYNSADRPVLYFNYFLETENHSGSDINGNNGDVNDPFRDSARVYISDDNGLTWKLVATNNSELSGANPATSRLAAGDAEAAELPGFLSHLSDAGLNSPDPRPRDHQIVQELFDNTGEWRQARIDLSDYANKANLKLRFDFSTAGAFYAPSDQSRGLPTTINNRFGEISHTQRSIRSLSNDAEGFYIDDILVGFAERGEMVTGAQVNATIGDLKTQARSGDPYDASSYPDRETGLYQLEIRRSAEFAGVNDDGDISIGFTYDTNDPHITNLVSSPNFTDSFEAGSTFTPSYFVYPLISPIGANWNRASTVNPQTGTRSAQAGAITHDQISPMEFTITGMTAGAIKFAYSVESELGSDGLVFMIDDVVQPFTNLEDITVPGSSPLIATGQIPYSEVTYYFGAGDHTFRWIYRKDGSGSFGRDTAFIDNIVILQGGSGQLGDENRARPQGQLILESNTISRVQEYGINVEADARTSGSSMPHPGSLINFPQTNDQKLIPGVVIQNNVIASTGQEGIRFRGDPSTSANAPVPFGRIVNNTIFRTQSSPAISVSGNASPTIMNNILARSGAGLPSAISIAPDSNTTEIHSNHFVGYATTGSTVTSDASAAGLINTFVDLASFNLYPAPGSKAIDSSLNLLTDRSNYATFKNELGIPPSNILSPARDVYGQLRVDDPDEDPLGGGSAVFKDRGAIDRADDEQPYATLLFPVDNDAAFLDQDRNDTVVYRTNVFLDRFSILLGDGPGPNSPFQGTGVDPNILKSSTGLDVSSQIVQVTRNGQPLVEDVDYKLGFSDANDVLLITPLSSLWEPQSVYVITLDNTYNPTGTGVDCVADPLDGNCIGIRDLAGNPLRHNQPDGKTVFTIILGDFEFDYGDAPDASFGTLQANNGVRHVLIPDDPSTPFDESLHLGSRVDADPDGRPVALVDNPLNMADGDDREQRFDLSTSTLSLVGRMPFRFRVPGNGGAGLNDNDSFIVNDGVNSVTFRFDLGANGATDVVIPYFNPDPAILIAERVVVAIQQQIDLGNLTGMTVSHLSGGVVSVTGGGVLATVNLAGSGGRLAVSNRLPISVQVPPTGVNAIVDQMQFVVDDGRNSPLTFEFDDTNAPGLSNTAHIQVPFTSGVGYNQNTIATAIAAAINAQAGPGKPLGNLDATAASALGGVVTVVNRSNTDEDDEDGVTIGKIFVNGSFGAGYTTAVEVVASAAGKLDAWIDFNGNKTFEPEEKIYDAIDVSAGSNFPTPINIANVAANVLVVPGHTYARFRISQNGGLFPTGLGVGGEVEDHYVRILQNADPIARNAFASFADQYDQVGGFLGNGTLDLNEDHVGTISIDLTNIDGGANGTVGDVYSDDVFDDIDLDNGNGDSLTFSIESNSNVNIVNAALANGNQLQLSFPANRNDDFGGPVRIVVRATDHAGRFLDQTLTVSVKPVNDAPILIPVGPNLLPATNEDTVSAQFAVSVFAGPTIADVDLASGFIPQEGIAITAVTGNGVWSYSTDAGGTFTPVGAVSATSALLLRDVDLVQYTPDNANGETPTITYLAWDQTGATVGQHGTKVDPTGNTGGTGPFSLANDIATLTVSSVNDAPVMVPQNPAVLPGISEDAAQLDFTVASMLGASVADVDTGALEGIAITAYVGNGQWFYNTGVAGFQPMPVIPANQGLLLRANDQLRYVPDQKNGEVATLSYFAWDQADILLNPTGGIVDVSTRGGTTSLSVAGDIAQIAVAAANDAPTLAPANPTLPTTNEDTQTPAATVATIVGATISDVDNGAVEGIAITSTIGNGTWEFSLDGINFNPVGAVSTANALLLRATDSLRYTPDMQNGEIASLTYQAWDQTAGVAGAKTSTAPNGGTTAFSVNSDILSLTVTSVNDSPVLVPAGPTLAPTDEDTTTPWMTVDSILGGNSGDVDNGATSGIAVVATTGNGRWEYSTNGGAGQVPVGTVSGVQALLLRGTDLLRYVPDLKNAETATITYRAWDQTPPTTGQQGSKRDASTFGGTTPYSAALDTATINVSGLNDAPVLSPIGPSLATVDEETPTANYSIASLIGASITDVDNGAVQGIAVTSMVANGTWQFSTDAGATFQPFGAVSSTSALLLRPQDLVKFVPDTFNGELALFGYRAWDQTGATAGMQGQKVDASATGGTTPFSIALDTIAVDVTHLNDAPILTPAAPFLNATDEDTDSTAQTVASFVGASVLDVDNVALRGIAITATSGNGTWQYSLDGTTFNPIGAVTGTSALLLRSTDLIRYAPDRINGETATITYRAWDQTVAFGLEGTKVNPSPTGGTAAYSIASDVGSLVVASINDQPTVTLGPATVTVEEDSRSGSLVFSTGTNRKITIADVDAEFPAPDQVNGGELIVNLAVQHGRLTMNMAGVTVIDGDGTDGTLSFSGLQAAVTAALEGLTYDPTLDFNDNRGAETLTITVNDQNGTGAEPPGYGPRVVVVPISVQAVNDQPVLTVGTNAYSLDEGTTTSSLNTRVLAGVTVFDEDEQETASPNDLLNIVLTVNADGDTSNGTLSVTPSGGVVTGGNGSRILQLTGTQAALNTVLATLTYQVPNPNFNKLNNVDPMNPTGDVFVSIQVNDLGNTGLGGTLTAPAQTIAVTVEPVNDAPVLTVTTPTFAMNEGASPANLNSRVLSGISVADDDEQETGAPDNTLQVTLTVVGDDDTNNGILSVATVGAAVAVGNQSRILTLTGPQNDVNQTLATLTYTVPHDNFNKVNNVDLSNATGNVFVSVALSDLGHTGQGGILTAPTQTVTVTVEPLNDMPLFDLAANVARDEDNAAAPALSVIPGVATSILPGPANATDEANQLLDFLVNVTSVTGNLVFDVPPDIVADPMNPDFGSLTFRTAKDTNGSAVLEVRLRDFVAGTPIGGSDLTTLVKRVTLTIHAVNDIPEFAVTTTNGGNVTVDEDAGLTVVPNWATSIRPGPATATDEVGQDLEFVVTTDNPALFSIAPTIDPNTGALQFRAADQSNGSATITVSLREEANPASTTLTVNRVITVHEINDVPVAASHPYSMQEDGGRTDNLGAAAPFAIPISDLTTTAGTKDAPGPANEAGQVLSIVPAGIGSTGSQGGTVQLSADQTQILYTPRANFAGTETFTYVVQDNGTSRGLADPKSVTGTITMTVTAVNDVPIAVNDPSPGNEASYATDENDALVVAGVGVIFNDTDDGGSQHLSLNSFDTTGTLGVVQFHASNNGDFTYTPGTQFDTLAQGQTATDKFSYQIKDASNALSNFATVTVTIRGRNDAPVTSAISLSTSEDAAILNQAFLGTDVDSEPVPQPLTYSIITDVPGGQGTVVNHGNGTFSFNPGSAYHDLKAGESRTVQFTYRATDQRGATSNISVVTITVNGVNDAPTASNGSLIASEDGTTAGTFPASDVDDAPSSLQYRIITPPSAGTVTVGTGNSFTFNPSGGFDGLQAGQTQQVTFTYGAKDAQNVESSGTITVTVTGVNDIPTATPISLTIAEDGGSVTGNFVGNDADDDDSGTTLQYVIVTNVPAGQGSLINNNNGTVTYSVGNIFQDLSVGQTRNVTFGYRARDRHGALSAIATATIEVAGTNDAPLAPAQSVATDENAELEVTLNGTDVDTGESGSLVYSILGGLGNGQGTLGTLNGNKVTFSPGTDFDGLALGQSQQITFSYQAKDVHDAFSIPGTVTITVNGKNDAPTAGPVSLSATEDGPRVTALLAGDDVDSNDDANSLTYQLVDPLPSDSGTVVLMGTRTIEFNPGSSFQDLSAGETENVTFTYRTRDRFGAESAALGTVTITVTGQNDAPVVSNLAAIAAAEDGTPVSGHFSGQDPDTADQAPGLLFSVVAQPSAGTVTASTVRGESAFTFAPGTGFQYLSEGQTQTVTFTYRAADQNSAFSTAATGTVVVTGQNDAPLAQNVTGISAQEDGGAVTGNFNAADPDSEETGGGLVYLLVAQPAEGTVTVNGAAGNRQFTFNPGSAFQDLALGEVRNVTFTYEVRDARGAIGNTATVTVAVSGRNEAPVADPVAVSGTPDGGVINGQFSANDADNDESGAGLTYFIVTQPPAGMVTTSGTPGDRSFSFDASSGFADLADGETRDVTFTYRARDTHGAQSPIQTVTVTVTGVNDAPVAGPVSTAAVEDGSPITITLPGNDVDSDDSPATLEYTIVTPPASGQGTLTNNGGQSATFTPGTDFQSLSAGETVNVTFTYRTTDQHGQTSGLATGTIVVTGVNDAPISQPVVTGTMEGTELTVPFATADLDPDSEDTTATLTYSVITPPPSDQGTLRINSGGTLTFTPAAGFESLSVNETRNVTFIYRATDRRGANSPLMTGTIVVTGVNDAPVVEQVTLNATERGSAVNGQFNGDDVDNDDSRATLSYALLDTVLTTVINQQTRTVGALTNNNNGTFTFVPDSNFRELGAGQSLVLTARYRATDAHNAQSSNALLTINFAGVNDAPTAKNDTAAANENLLLSIDAPGLLGAATDSNRDLDPDQGDFLTVVAFDSVSALGAAVSVSGDGSYRYDPRASTALNSLAGGVTIEDTFKYTIQDSSGLQSTATVTVTVTGENDPPLVQNDTLAANADEATSVPAPGVLQNDTDPDNNTLTVIGFSPTSSRGAGVEVDADGAFRYFPNSVPALQALKEGQSLQDTFTYQASDGAGGTGTATVTVTVHGVNDAPVANHDSYNGSEDNTLSVARASGVLRNDVDPDGDTLTASLVAGPANGTLLSFNADGSFSYRPNANFSGTDTFTYKLSDGSLESGVATATITVAPVNDPPVAVNDSYAGTQATTLTVNVQNGVLSNDTDIDGVTLSASVVRAPANGALTLNADGSFTFVPAASFSGQDSFTYRVSDGAGGVSNVATVALTIGSNNPWQNPVNRFDVNNDGSVSPIDVLVIVNDLNTRGARALPIPPVPPFTPPPFLDVNGDRSVSPQDALGVINRLNLGEGTGGEGEGFLTVPTAEISDAVQYVVAYLPEASAPVSLSPAGSEASNLNRGDGTPSLVLASNNSDLPNSWDSADLSGDDWDELLDVLVEGDEPAPEDTDQAVADLFG